MSDLTGFAGRVTGAILIISLLSFGLRRLLRKQLGTSRLNEKSVLVATAFSMILYFLNQGFSRPVALVSYIFGGAAVALILAILDRRLGARNDQ